jgi:hypothetical protein
MDLPRFTALAALSLLLVSGCRREEPAPPHATAPPTPATVNSGQLAARLTAALEIATVSSRDEALGKLAADAAAAGEKAVTLKAIQQVASLSDRDRYAAVAARRLAQAGSAEGALEVARTISAVSTRDETLKQIATGTQAPAGDHH